MLAAYDTEPHKITSGLLEALSDAGELARRELRVSELGSMQQQLLAGLDASGREGLLDGLTRLWNRRGAMLLLEQALDGGKTDVSIGVCVMGVDGLKQLKNQHGETAGDSVLNKLGAAIVDSVRPGDIACRLGADEFLLLIPDVDPDHLGDIMDRVKGRAQSLVVRTRAGSVKVTVSIGGALGGEGDRPEDVLRRAQEAMQDGKRRRGCGAGGETPQGPIELLEESAPNPDF